MLQLSRTDPLGVCVPWAMIYESMNFSSKTTKGNKSLSYCYTWWPTHECMCMPGFMCIIHQIWQNDWEVACCGCARSCSLGPFPHCLVLAHSCILWLRSQLHWFICSLPLQWRPKVLWNPFSKSHQHKESPHRILWHPGRLMLSNMQKKALKDGCVLIMESFALTGVCEKKGRHH